MAQTVVSDPQISQLLHGPIQNLFQIRTQPPLFLVLPLLFLIPSLLFLMFPLLLCLQALLFAQLQFHRDQLRVLLSEQSVALIKVSGKAAG